VYGFARFWFDFLRATEGDKVAEPDLRYFGLTPAQYFAIAIFAAGVWLLFVRKPKPEDLAYAKETDRLAQQREKAAAKAAAGEAKAEQREP
jgi:phosphatidylglycerol:prolipoprotein diacylglycerol transferase